MTGFKENDNYDALGLAELVANGEVAAGELLGTGMKNACDRDVRELV